MSKSPLVTAKMCAYTYTSLQLIFFSQISETIFAAGQIGLDPAQMVLVDPKDQPSLSLIHTRTVLKACHAYLNSALCGMCYFTTEEAAWRAREAWKQVVVEICTCSLIPIPHSSSFNV